MTVLQVREVFSIHPSLVSNGLVIYNSFWRYTWGYYITLLAVRYVLRLLSAHTHIYTHGIHGCCITHKAACIGWQYLISHTNEVGKYSSTNDACIWNCFSLCNSEITKSQNFVNQLWARLMKLMGTWFFHLFWDKHKNSDPRLVTYSLVPIRRHGSINRHTSFIWPYTLNWINTQIIISGINLFLDTRLILD